MVRVTARSTHFFSGAIGNSYKEIASRVFTTTKLFPFCNLWLEITYSPAKITKLFVFHFFLF